MAVFFQKLYKFLMGAEFYIVFLMKLIIKISNSYYTAIVTIKRYILVLNKAVKYQWNR